MALALQLLGCVAAVLLVRYVFFDETTRRSIAVSTAIVAATVVPAMGVRELWPADTLDAARGQGRLSESRAEAAGAERININAGFVEWVAAQVPEDARYLLHAPSAKVEHWTAYRLLPRIATRDPSAAEWVILYGTSPQKVGYEHRDFVELRSYEPGFRLGRLRPEGA